MKLVKVEVTGFKSFQKKTTFEFKNNLIGVVGPNGSGKSTLISCASSVFYQMPMIEFFGRPENASINFMLNEMTRSWECNGKVWTSQSSKNRMNISGFY